MNYLLAKVGVVESVVLPVENIPIIDLEESVHEWSFYDVVVQHKADKLRLAQHRKKLNNPGARGLHVMTDDEAKKFVLSKMMNYINIESIITHFDPTVSFTDSYCDVRFMILDDRFGQDHVSREAINNSNIPTSHIMCLDHSVHLKNLKDLKFRVEILNNPLAEGVVWGSLKFSLSMKMAHTAVSNDLLPTLAVYRAPASLLATHKRDPRFIRLSMTQRSLDTAKEKLKKGQIMDLTKERHAQKIDFSKLAGSAAGSDISKERAGDFEEGSEDGMDNSALAKKLSPIDSYRAQQEKLRQDALMSGISFGEDIQKFDEEVGEPLEQIGDIQVEGSSKSGVFSLSEVGNVSSKHRTHVPSKSSMKRKEVVINDVPQFPASSSSNTVINEESEFSNLSSARYGLETS